jgi:tetratricopeptide (TPR) repeat protein
MICNMRFLIIFIALIGAIVILQCTPSSPKSLYQNIGNSKAEYMGMDKCKTCHADVYKTYMETGMGQSWGIANPSKSAGNFDANVAHVFDAKSNLHYKPYWVGDSLHILEYRLQDGDTVHRRDETIQYIVGSGQHTNSHIYSSNGYLHQAPITFYTQLGKWDLAPGFEDENTRFDRKIETECITCHNGYPEHIAGSINKYQTVKLGIDCERCHGPGSLHVNGVLAGKIHDTSKSPDYRIVNPKRMSTEQQNNLCQRCHLQGVAVLNDDKSFFDFQPSTTLSDNWNVFMPEYKNKKNHMIMASHVERMKMSKCYTVSGKMSCITCHNPHISVKNTSIETYNTACKNCHTSSNTCSEKLAVRQSNQDNCNACHMKKNGSIDIPHVAVHDHYIRKRINDTEPELANDFLGLTCYNNNNVSAIQKARSFLEFYERYLQSKVLLDSALFLLNEKQQAKQYQNKDLIRVYFLQENYNKVAVLAAPFTANTIQDHWNAYRIGEALMKTNQNEKALVYLQQACKLMPYALDYQNKLGDCYTNLNNVVEAKKVYQYIIAQNPKNAQANGNLGYLYLQAGDMLNAKKYMQDAVRLNPNNVQYLINMSVIHYNLQQLQPIKPLLKEALGLDANNAQVKAMLKDLK